MADDALRHISTASTGTSKERPTQYEDAQREIHVGSDTRADSMQESKNARLDLQPREEIYIVDWNGTGDSENPFNWSRSYKWTATLTTCFISILTGLPAGAYGAASEEMTREWHLDQDDFPFLSFALVTWNMGAAIFPLVFVPLTESTGRLPGYFAFYIMFIIWLIPCAWAPNFATMLVARFFGGGASSVSITLVAGTITDIWKGDRERSLPFSIFGMTSVVGIALGPLIGGSIQAELWWRWIYWIQIIVCVAFLPIFYFILSETRGDIILAKRAKNMRANGYRNAYARSELDRPGVLEALKISFMRPTKMLLTEFVVISFTVWVSFAWGLLFLFQSSVPIVMRQVYGFDTLQVTLIQLAVSVGAIIATLLNPFQDSLYFRSARDNPERPGHAIPEARIYTAVPGSLLFAAAMFWFGATANAHTSFWVPTVALAAFGIGVYSIYLGVTNYLADAYEKYAASALSAAGFGRNVFGAFLPLATPALYRRVGVANASYLLGAIALVLTALPCILLWRGAQIRARSPFMLEAVFDVEEGDERKKSLATAKGQSLEEFEEGRRASAVAQYAR